MIRSMTGFGRAGRELDGTAVAIEVSAVNHRYFDCYCRLPPAWAALESVAKQTVRARLARGKINVSVVRKRATTLGLSVCFDAGVAKGYLAAARELAQLMGRDADGGLSIDTLAQLEGVFYTEEPEEDLDRGREVMVVLINEALDQLDNMRRIEGDSLAADVRLRIANIRQILSGIEERLPQLNKFYEDRLRARISELQEDLHMPEERIAIEVAVLAEKGDVTEEVVRLKTHLSHATELLDGGEPVGRRLDFLSQEIQREINTLGVKTRDADVAKEIIGMKAELEKLREQVQNIE